MKPLTLLIPMMFFFAACGVPQEEHNLVSGKLSECETKLEESAAKNDSAQSELHEMAMERDGLKGELQEKADALRVTNEKKEAAEGDLASAEAKRKELKGTVTNLEAELKKAREDVGASQKLVAATKEKAEKAQAEMKTCRAKLSMYRSETGVDGDAIDSSENPMAAEYAQFLDIQVTAARYIDTYTQGRVPGLRFLVKNTGKRSVSLLKVIVYFQDKDGATIGEQDVFLVQNKGFDPTGILRPNYSIKVPGERDKYMTAAHITDSWKKGSVDIKVVEIEFEE